MNHLSDDAWGERTEDDDGPQRATERGPQRLVLAEDDDDVREGLEEILARDGYDITSVPDGQQLATVLAVCETRRKLPDVIVTDHRMPGYTAIDILCDLREARWNVPVIVVTAYGRDVRDVLLELGASAVFDKPFDPDELRAAVRTWADWTARLARSIRSPRGSLS